MRAIMYNLFAYLDQFSYEKYYEKVDISYRKGKIIFLSVVFFFAIVLIFVMSFSERNEIVQRNMLLTSASQEGAAQVAVSFDGLYGGEAENTLQFNIPVDNNRSKNLTYFETTQLFTAHSIIFRNTTSFIKNKSAGKLFLVAKNIGDTSSNNLDNLMYQSSSPAISDLNIYKYHIRC